MVADFVRVCLCACGTSREFGKRLQAVSHQWRARGWGKGITSPDYACWKKNDVNQTKAFCVLAYYGIEQYKVGGDKNKALRDLTASCVDHTGRQVSTEK